MEDIAAALKQETVMGKRGPVIQGPTVRAELGLRIRIKGGRSRIDGREDYLSLKLPGCVWAPAAREIRRLSLLVWVEQPRGQHLPVPGSRLLQQG
jgi:hypothetical protein